MNIDDTDSLDPLGDFDAYSSLSEFENSHESNETSKPGSSVRKNTKRSSDDIHCRRRKRTLNTLKGRGKKGERQASISAKNIGTCLPSGLSTVPSLASHASHTVVGPKDTQAARLRQSH